MNRVNYSENNKILVPTAGNLKNNLCFTPHLKCGVKQDEQSLFS